MARDAYGNGAAGGDAAARMRAFASEVRARPELATMHALPEALWRRMGGDGLLGLGTPKAYGGAELAPEEQAALGETLVEVGRNLGVSTIWQGHNTLTRYLFGFADAAQKTRWLPRLAAGDTTVAVAISEPGVGAHPKHLSTRATPTADGWRLDGRKAYVTNGPLAGLFAVLAVTGEDAGRKRYSVFLVERGTPGLSFGEGHVGERLLPAGHCGLILEACAVAPGAVLGPLHDAYRAIAQPLRDVEDLLRLGPLVGAILAQIDMIAERAEPGDEDREALGGLLARVAALRALRRAAFAAMPAERRPLLLAVAGIARDAQATLNGIRARNGLAEDAVLGRFAADMDVILGIARYVERSRLGALADARLKPTDRP
ncbi:MAG: acyl-CoA dehydrogenase family protein [Alphaproteobacteria bacterium]